VLDKYSSPPLKKKFLFTKSCWLGNFWDLFGKITVSCDKPHFGPSDQPDSASPVLHMSQELLA